MNKTEIIAKTKKYSFVAGIVAVVIFVITTIVLSSACNSIADYLGAKPTFSELGESIEQIEIMATKFGGSIDNVAEMVGVSKSTLTFVKLSLAIRIPVLIIAIIALVILGGIVVFENNPDIAKKVTGMVSDGAGVVGGAVKTTYGKATVKCDKCGKTFIAGKKFCPECGNKIDDSLECKKCGTFSKAGTKFCPNCGTSLEQLK